MAHLLVMPRQGNTVESCLLVAWKADEGAAVTAEQVLCEVETDKATFDVPAGTSGVLLKRLRAEGEDVPVLEPIAVIGRQEEDWRSALGEVAPPAAAVDPAGAPPPPRAGEAIALTSVPGTGPSGSAHRGVSPRARRLAREAAIDPAVLPGTGPDGRVIERDVRSALQHGPALTSAAPAGAADGYADAPLKNIRKIIAERMRASLASTAQLTFNGSAPAARISALRARFKASEPSLGLSEVTVGDLVSYAVCRVVPRFSMLNAHLLGTALRTFERVHLGFAVDTPRGLMVPVIRNADLLSLTALSAEAKRLAAACQEGGIKLEELSGATFTVSNLGALGVESFTPVLNPPEVAILGVCAIVPRPVVGEDGAVHVEPRMGLSLTVDHQVIDGAPAARILRSFADAIAEIDLLWTR